LENDIKWLVYIVLCKDNTLYCGTTINIDNRIEKHNNGKGAKYINSQRRPVRLVYKEGPFSKSEAFKREYDIKKKSRKDKLKLIEG